MLILMKKLYWIKIMLILVMFVFINYGLIIRFGYVVVLLENWVVKDIFR